MQLPTDPRERAIVLLEANHTFPGLFEFRVVVRPEARESVVAALIDAAGGADRVHPQSERPSSNGSYVAVRIQVELQHAAHVLDVYEILRAVDGVVTVL